MTKVKCLILFFVIAIMVAMFPIISYAVNEDVNVTRNIISSGNMTYNFSGLTLDIEHEYEFAIGKTAAEQLENWNLITEYTESTAVINFNVTTKVMRDVINTVDTGYITIKDKTADSVVLEKYAIDLKIPYLNVTTFSTINNGKEFEMVESESISVPLRNGANSQAYYQYEKITDENIINEYKRIKNENGNFLELQDSLKNTNPTSNWTAWAYWNGHDSSGLDGFGYPQDPIQAPNTGLYYLWLYFKGDNVKDLYGYILVDNLEADIPLENISLPETETVELGKTITLEPTFNPIGATNKIVTWESSDETVATVNNAGVVTPIKVGSTIITVTAQDGNRKATCTVTVTDPNENNGSNDGNENNETNTTTTPDFSKAKFNFSYTTFANLKLEITGIEISEDYKYYVGISKNKDEQFVDGVTSMPYISKNDEGRYILYLSTETSRKTLEEVGKNYIYIVEKNTDNTLKILLNAKEMEELELPPLGKRLDMWLYEAERTGMSNMIHVSENRNIIYKFGKIDSKDVLRSFKNDSVNEAYNNLLQYAMTAPILTKGTITEAGLDYNIAKDLQLEKNGYYFVYMIADTNNGKYNELVDVAIYKASKTEGGNELVHFAFNTIEVEDDTVVQEPEIPKAGTKMAVAVTTLLAISLLSIIFYKNSKKLRDII